MKTLQISDTLKLPPEALTETFAVLGKRGSGKTNFGVVLVEELVGAGLPVVVIDPVGVWSGLRSSADGTSKGLPVTLLGGERGDVPIEEGAGAVIADFVVEARQPCVIDLSLFRKGQAVRFMTDFAERLYHAKGTKRDALHVVVDEADAFAPQNPRPETARLLGAMEDLVRRGRSRGLGLTLITQRPASLNKNVLTQAEVLVVFQLVGPLDRKAIDEWVKMNGSDEERAQLLSSIASLPVGTAWVWSPSWLKTFQKVAVRRRWTFDSSATPKAGAKRIEPKVLAPVDLAALRGRIAETIERAKADDPRELRKRIAELEKELRAKPGAATPAVKRVEVPVLGPREAARLEKSARDLQDVARAVAGDAAIVIAALARIQGAGGPAAPKAVASFTAPSAPTEPRPATFTKTRTATKAVDGAPALGKCERAILSVLATHGTRNKTQVAIQAGYTNSGGFRNALGALRSAGLIDGGGDAISITSAGADAIGVVEPLPQGRALFDYWKDSAGGKCERAILSVLAEHHPRAMTKEDVAAAAGYEMSGGFRNALGRLRSLQLITPRGEIALTETLGDALRRAA